MTTCRASNWLLTIYYDNNNNEVGEQYNPPQMPPGWKCEGQIERCPETQRLHYQGKLHTPQVRMSQLQNIFGKKNHFEIIKNVNAVSNYVHKEETRVCEVATAQTMSMYEFSDHIAKIWDESEFNELVTEMNAWNERHEKEIILNKVKRRERGDLVLEYVDNLVMECIEEGVRGAEWNATNPAFRAMWKKFGEAVVRRNKAVGRQTDRQTESSAVKIE